ncbi:hypothetical protein C9422_18825 [Pseudomonas sp. B1(2018)]|uniref:tail fiber assembly protein n=1 Tax=Pseudomonas sp. B1(2018) TaxID=2233856 RepID=UPI000D5EC1F6|nr:tail fiber assembly protein [Pseudomonas sp. B1(2018)]PVZ56577.1 hypothetical protein C9422_18825 [Pseudomonas sp. B1(2018)]
MTEAVKDTTTIYVQIIDGRITAVFWSPQDPEYWPGLVVMEDDDQRYLDFLNPHESILAVQSAKLQELTQLAAAQKVALINRISTLNDSIELEMATPEEVAELPVRTAQLKQWKTYAVLLGRVTGQTGWPPEVTWPTQPAEGMDLTVSAVAPDVA